jgi:hypothetical protein
VGGSVLCDWQLTCTPFECVCTWRSLSCKRPCGSGYTKP